MAHEDPLPSVLLPCMTSHRRLLPTTSPHAFSYPLVYIGVDIDELEDGKLDIPAWFGYGSKWLSMLSVQKEEYLMDSKVTASMVSSRNQDGPSNAMGSLGDESEHNAVGKGHEPPTDARSGSRSRSGKHDLRQRLTALLWARHGIPSEEVGRVWLLTMPSYFGKSAMNPLSVWFVYRSSKADPKASKEKPENETIQRGSNGRKEQLLAVVLEVHNTFGERHTYVLRVGQNSVEPKSGHDYAWIFPRTFHVSPFNDRSGYYRLDLRHPLSSRNFRSERAHVENKSEENHTHLNSSFVRFKVTLNQLTEDKRVKLFANLQNHPNPLRSPVQITASSIYQTVLYRQPLDLFFTSPRILAQAWSLHYRKGLQVFPRPEPQALPNPADTTMAFDDPNPTGAVDGTGNAIGWQGISLGEKRLARLVLKSLQARCDATGMAFTLRHCNPAVGLIAIKPSIPNLMEATELSSEPDSGYASAEEEQKSTPNVEVVTRDPIFFTRLTMSFTPDHYLVASAGEGHTITDDDNRFKRFFTEPLFVRTKTRIETTLDRWTHRIRTLHFLFLVGFVLRPVPPRFISSPPRDHFVQPESAWDRWIILYVLATTYAADVIEEWAMHSAGARFVDGFEPWGTWRRAMDKLWSNSTDVKPTSLEDRPEGSVFDGHGCDIES